jgi:glyoxylase-like metal-dependent hydrolase (beta-lactamase superfamily II)
MAARYELTRLITAPNVNNVFIVQCKITKQSILIDAAGDGDLLVKVAAEKHVGDVLTTHGHWDHIGAVPEMRSAGHRVGIGINDANQLDAYDFDIEDGDVFNFGELTLEAMHTPGHTPGSTCYFLHDTNVLFTGDTLFPNGPGATHFPGGDFDQIINSIDTRLYQRFDDDVIVWPGHGDSTTIGTERPHLAEWIDKYGSRR